jgi:hypothetical protein
VFLLVAAVMIYPTLSALHRSSNKLQQLEFNNDDNDSAVEDVALAVALAVDVSEVMMIVAIRIFDLSLTFFPTIITDDALEAREARD